MTQRNLTDLTGLRFYRLLVLRRVGDSVIWECVCDCGRTVRVKGACLRSGNNRSCSCLQKENIARQAQKQFKHGHSYGCRNADSEGSYAYRSWASMKSRCFDVNHKAYKDYGGRGITICDRWLEFSAFFEDMGDRPEGKSLERRDNSKGYSPDNCYWATRKEQQNNTRRCHLIEYQGKTQNITQWAEELGIKAKNIYSRIGKGWTPVEALAGVRQ